MTTHLYREYDPQSRKISIKNPASSGGSTEDESSVILHFSYTQKNYLDDHIPFIVFDILDETGKRIYFSPISHPAFDGLTFAIPYSVSRRASQNKLRYVLAFTQDGEDPELIIEQSALEDLPLTHSFIDALIIRAGLPVELPRVSNVIKDVTYDDSTSTFTFTRVDDTFFRIGLSDLAEDHFEVSTQSELVTLTEAQSGDTATALDTGVWYKLYGDYSILNNWKVMSGNITINGQQTGTPVFYAPVEAGTSSQYLESRGVDNSPEWVSKSTQVENSTALVTSGAVKSYVDPQFSDHDSRLNTLEGYNLNTRLTEAEGTIQEHTDSLSDLNEALDDETERAIDAEGELRSDLEDEIRTRGELQTTVTQHGTRIQGAEDDITSLENRMGTAESDINTAEADIDTLETGLTAANDDISALNGWKNGTVDPMIFDHESRLDTVESTVNDNHGPRIATAEDTIRSQGDDIDSLDSSLSSLDETVGRIITYLPGNVSTNNPLVSYEDMSSADQGLESRIQNLEQDTINHAGTGLVEDKSDSSYRTISHETVTRSDNAGSGVPVSNGGSFTILTGVESNEMGHVTRVNSDLVTLPTIEGERGISVDDSSSNITITHTNSITSGHVGGLNKVPIVYYDSQGHITDNTTEEFIQISESQVTGLSSALGGKAPTNHASANGTYGLASTTEYGHVKVVRANSEDTTAIVPTEAKMEAFVNSSIGTATANFLGTYKALDDTGNPNSLGFTQAQVDEMEDPMSSASSALAYALALKISSPSPNDYVFVEMDFTTPATSPDEYRRYKWNGSSWQYEYTLNNSSFTQEQWDAINSKIHNSGSTGVDIVDILNHHEDSAIHVTTANKTAWNAKYDKPSGGIPKSDLASAVQTSLGKADTALQRIKTINSTSMVGTGNINLQTPLTAGTDYVVPVSGKGLSTNDYTTADKNKLAGIAAGAEVNVQSDWNQTTKTADDFIKNKPSFKTVNSNSVVGTGNIAVQPTLVGSGTGQNIKTVGGTNILGSGNIAFPTLSGGAEATSGKYVSGVTVSGHAVTVTQANLPSLSKGTQIGGGNVVTDVAVSGHAITLTKGKTLGADIPEPMTNVKGQALIVNSDGNGFIFGEAGKVDDVKVNNASVVSNKIASITVPVAATATPSNLGTAAVGTSAKYAREDHVHKKPTLSELGAAAASHTHAISDVTNLQTTLDGKAASSHNHDGRYWQVLGDLGSSYTMTYSDFNQAYPCRRKVNTFATKGESPDGANVGDYYLYSLGHTDNRGYSTIIAVTPRLNGANAGTRMFIGHFWNGAWKGWTEVAPTTSIPTALSQLSDDSTHRLVTDIEKTTWSNKSNLAIGTTSSTAAAGNHAHGNIANDGSISSNKGTLVVTNSSTGKLEASGTTLSTLAPKASPALTGTPTAPTATAGTNTDQIATTKFVMSAFQANDAMIFKGTVNAASDLPATHYQGWTYKVATAGSYLGQNCEVGDMIICVTDGTAANNAHWAIIQNNIDGAVTGPASATGDRFASFNGTTGKIIKDSGYSASSFAPKSHATNGNTYGYGDATNAGHLRVGSNITVSNGTISLTKANVTSALGYTPPTTDTNTTYSAGYKLEASGTTFNARKCIVGHSGSTLTYTWYKVASISHSNAYTDYHITFKVWAGYADSSTRMGILSAHLRTNKTGFEGAQLVWEEAQSGIDATHFVLLRNSSGGSFPCNCEIWAYCNTSWQAYHFDVLSEGDRAGFSKPWTLYTNVTDAAVSGQVGTAYTTGMTAQNSTFGTLKNVATPASHTHNYAGSSEAGGAATTALACSGNAATATTLQTTRSINGTNFNGSANITTSKWGTARNITISDNDGTNTQATNSIDGSANFTLKLPATIKASLTGNCSGSSGSCTGNAATATQFSANKSVTLTGDVTGTASSKAGWSVATTLAASGVTAGSYGPSDNATPAYGATFNVPYITVDAKGRVTAASTKTVKIPSSDQSDANVKQTLKATSDTGTYPIILKNSTTKTDSPIAGTNYVAAVYVKPSAGEITATNFAGKHSGYTLGAACAKGVDTTVTANSANLVTSGGVATALANYQTAGSYAAATHNHTTAEVTACTGYSAGSDATLAASDTLNGALGKAQGQISALKNHNYETYKTAASVASNGLNSLTSGFRYITSYAILGKTSNWMIESISSAAGGYVMQRATDFADPSNVCIRTKNGSSASWSTWTYSYAVWKV